MSATKQVTDILGRQVKRALDDGAEALGDTAKSVAKRRDKTRDTSSQTRGNDHYDGGSPGRPRGDDGRFLPREDGPVDSRYERPSGWRAGLREEAWGRGRTDGAGRVIDPETDLPIDPDGAWAMGHPPGYEFRHHQRTAAERGLTRADFLDEYYSVPYRPESISTSSRGAHELPWEQYIGPGSASWVASRGVTD